MKRASLAQLFELLIIVAAGIWIYWPVFRGDWLWDDDRYVTANPLLHTLNGLGKIWAEPGALDDYYPISATVQWIQWHLWGADTLGYHLTNVVLHIISSLLVWRLLAKFGLHLAWLGGLLFVVHPVTVESVAWISELKNALSLPLFLLAMTCWINYEDRSRPQDYYLSLGLFVAAMLCKTSMAAFPLAIFLYRWWKRDEVGWKTLKACAPFFAVSVILGLVTLWTTQRTVLHDNLVTSCGAASRIAAAGLMMAFAFSKAVLPLGLMAIYPAWKLDPPSTLAYLPWPILFGVLSYLWIMRKSWGRHMLLGLGFFLLMLAPVLIFVAGNYATMAYSLDHLSYLPLVGLIGLIVAGLEKLSGKGALVPSLGGLAVAAMLAGESRSYASLFTSEDVLWTHTLEQNPQAWLAHDNLGARLMKRGEGAVAMQQFEQALAIKPGDARSRYNLGVALMQAGNVAKATAQFQQALQNNPKFAQAHNNLGEALAKEGNWDGAQEQYEAALNAEPDYVDAHYNLGVAEMQSGRVAEAIGQYEEAVALAPDKVDALNNLGAALLQVGRVDEAVTRFEQVLKTDPNLAEAHFNLGNAQKHTGKMAEAIDQFSLAVQINPNYAEAHNNLGIALFQGGKIPEAIAQFEAAYKLNPRDMGVRDNLARARDFQQRALKK